MSAALTHSLLPMVARQIILNMLFLDGPLTVEDCLKFFQQRNTTYVLD